MFIRQCILVLQTFFSISLCFCDHLFCTVKLYYVVIYMQEIPWGKLLHTKLEFSRYMDFELLATVCTCFSSLLIILLNSCFYALDGVCHFQVYCKLVNIFPGLWSLIFMHFHHRKLLKQWRFSRTGPVSWG